MSNKTKWLPVGIVAAFALLAALTWGMGSRESVQAAPAALVTPITVYAGGTNPSVATLFSATAKTSDGGGTEVLTGAHEKIDLQAVVDVGTVNTTTLKLQFSNDGTNWIDGSTFGSALTADANTMQQYPVYGRYVRAYADVTNSSPITLTVIGVLR